MPNRLGAVLLQFPWSFKNTPESREQAGRSSSAHSTAIRRRSKCATRRFRTRSSSQFLDEHDVAWVNVDQPLFHDSVKPADAMTGPLAYARLHGRNYEKWFAHGESWERYNYLYSSEELEPWVDRIQTMATDEGDVRRSRTITSAARRSSTPSDLKRPSGRTRRCRRS